MGLPGRRRNRGACILRPWAILSLALLETIGEQPHAVFSIPLKNWLSGELQSHVASASQNICAAHDRLWDWLERPARVQGQASWSPGLSLSRTACRSARRSGICSESAIALDSDGPSMCLRSVHGHRLFSCSIPGLTSSFFWFQMLWHWTYACIPMYTCPCLSLLLLQLFL